MSIASFCAVHLPDKNYQKMGQFPANELDHFDEYRVGCCSRAFGAELDATIWIHMPLAGIPIHISCHV